MNTKFTFTIASLLGSIVYNFGQVKPQPAKEKIVVDEYFGQKIEDAYQYLENLEDPNVVNWMKSNANYARAKLDEVPERQNLIKKLKELDTRKESTITDLQITENNHYFYLKRNANEENGKLYLRIGYEGAEKLLLDPETYKKSTKANYNISSITPNEKGDKVAVEIAASGSENAELLIINSDGKVYPEVIDRCWFSSPSWLPDGNSFTYARLNSSNITDPNRLLNSKVYYHEVGKDANKDIEYFSSATNPELNIAAEEFPFNYFHKNSSKNYGQVVTVDNRIKLYTTDLKNNFSPAKWKILVDKKDEVINYHVDKEFIYYLTFKNAPNFKIIKVPIAHPEIENATNVINESKYGNITDFVLTKDGLYYSLTVNGVQAKVYFLPKEKTNPVELKLPFQSGAASFLNINENKSEIWITLTGWTSPKKRYLYNPETNNFIYQPLSKAIEYPEFKDIISKEITVTSHDGIKLPVSLIYNKNTKLNGENPVLIMGYGAYGASIDPYFSTMNMTYCAYGGIYVIAHVRGGGELGETWHKAGYKTTKPNTWKDLIATAEYLIQEKYTSSKKIAIWSASAGGILIGRAITERPDLFAAAIAQVGEFNTIRSEIAPNGPPNIPEFGTVKDPVEFKALLEMDSFHHIKKGTAYPATLITAGMNDPRVIAWQPSKFAAAFQNANTSDNPILFFTDFESGHGMGDSVTKNIEKASDLVSFAYTYTGHPKFQPSKNQSQINSKL
ncbi:oligopeptidase B [Flavobacterium cutihirudinis]|uniref:prolyl oligopeptidase n=1 Tax=Flavobacterium cutihirudinis TaxID=1265740 RepID=A0A3D9FZ07_9FLAO|nr:prolyl oligopeptidase family serine peptidase [Flavobacterium cutihirudinis]RED26200.1 oligopeptidase B [Flavobacterium cutihirudinis]